ncbi:transposase [Gemmata massiliana]|uniref:transposase n=1 Tax=Gemmata massiliana TaxID=1210884 RepID=UPI0013A6C042
MLARHAISDADWDRVTGLVPSHGPKNEPRRFVDAVSFVARTGIPWRDRPERFGHWNGVWRRFDRWPRLVCGRACSRHSRTRTWSAGSWSPR